MQPCRGDLEEAQITNENAGHVEVGENSCRLIVGPNLRNFIVFYSTVESIWCLVVDYLTVYFFCSYDVAESATRD